MNPLRQVRCLMLKDIQTWLGAQVKIPGMCLLALSSPLGVMNILLSQPLPWGWEWWGSGTLLGHACVMDQPGSQGEGLDSPKQQREFMRKGCY